MLQRSPLSLQLSVLTAFGMLDASKKRGRGIGEREGQFLRSRCSSKSARSCQWQVKHLQGLVRWLKETCCPADLRCNSVSWRLEFLAGFLQGIANLNS